MTSNADEIILFDLPSRAPRKAWSLNPWKTRLLLNYKGLNYKTEWVEYPDVKSRLEGHVTPPASSAGMSWGAYTIPTIKLPSGEYIMESRVIANAIEASHPSPPLHLESEYLSKLEAIMPRLMNAVRPIFIPLLPKRVLTEESIPYFVRTRAESVGTDLETFEKEKGGEAAWQEAAPAIKEVTALLKENEGDYFMGQTVSYADFVWAGFLLFFKAMGEDVFQSVLDASGDGEVHERLLKGVKVWAERDDH